MRARFLVILAVLLFLAAGILAALAGLSSGSARVEITTTSITVPGKGKETVTVTTVTPEFRVGPTRTRTVVKTIFHTLTRTTTVSHAVTIPRTSTVVRTETVHHTVTVPGQTHTVTVQGPSHTVTVQGPTITVTRTVTVSSGGGKPPGVPCPPNNPHCS